MFTIVCFSPLIEKRRKITFETHATIIGNMYRFYDTYYILVFVEVRDKKSTLRTMENLIESNRGKQQLILDHFKFRIGSSNKDLFVGGVQLKTVQQKFIQMKIIQLLTIQIHHITTMVNIPAKH
uniref:Uncharacterized protein n=1 Tax=Schizaphis graminum TaxID=13262 RepID=A0A2S2PHH3_SCHGA